MKPYAAMTFTLMLLLSSGVFAEGGKQRGDVGQGAIVQDQVRVVEPPAQWTATSAPADKKAASSQTALEDLLDAMTEAEELF
jgi:hypothetical protein